MSDYERLFIELRAMQFKTWKMFVDLSQEDGNHTDLRVALKKADAWLGLAKLEARKKLTESEKYETK